MREAFDPYRLAAAVAPEHQQQQQQHLRLMFTCAGSSAIGQAVDRVVGALESLVAAACTCGAEVAGG